MAPGRVLDLGAGEGKNAIFLAQLGFQVLAVECSSYALRNFKARLGRLPHSTASRVEIVQRDVLRYTPPKQFDAVIAYGLLHCLPNMTALNGVVQMMQAATRPSGFNVAVTFTDRLPVPGVHAYLEPTLIPEGYLSSLYSSWELICHENETIEEVHPTSQVTHTHSLCRLLARRPQHGQ
jgi:cyclopropane fatty-acyl-phospholipid synthase-like methyltransferase